MQKAINKLLKYLQKFADFKSKKTAANFLLIVFSDTQFFELPENNQKMILNNLIDYFNNLVYNDSTKKQNKHINQNTIKKHIICKVNDLCNYPEKLY